MTPSGKILVLSALGCYCLLWAWYFSAQAHPEPAVYTSRDYSDFAGDVTKWLRSAGE